MSLLINKIIGFFFTGKILNKLKTAIVFCMIFFGALIVKAASNPYSADIRNIDTSQYPIVSLNVDMTSSMGTNLTGKNFTIIENGKKNNSPIIILPPGSFNNVIDIVILLDKSGNTANYDKIIKNNLHALVRYLKDKQVSLNIKLVTFGNTDTSYSLDIHNLSDNQKEFDELIGNMEFDGTQVERIYGLEKLFSITTQSYRNNAEKIALIINGSQYYDKEHDEKATYSTSEIIKNLIDNNFTVFVSGMPTKQMVKNIKNNAEDNSLSHSIKGGYLGSFSSDLTEIYDLLKKKASNKYVVRYFSELPPDTGSGANVELNIGEYSINNFIYPQINSAKPEITHDPQPALFGAPYGIKINLDNKSKFINAVELVYWGTVAGQKSLFLEHIKNEDSESSMVYEAEIPAEDISGENLFFYYILHTPFDTIDLYADVYSVQVLEYDTGITLIPQLVNNKEVLWRWEGETVDKGSKYQLYNGDKLLAETSNRYFTVPLGDCDLYQIVKLRVLIKPDADHKKAGEWSLYSLPAEYYAGPTGTVTEKAGVGKMFECFSKKEAVSFNDFISGEPDYSAESELALNKMLEYMTGVSDSSLRNGMIRSQYSTLYYFMHFINNTEIKTYGRTNNKINEKVMYKLITEINQVNDFSSGYREAKNQVAEWMLGRFSF